jgi:hypothetical protein
MPVLKDSLASIHDNNIRTIDFIGRTKDGTYTQRKTFALNQHPDMDVNVLDAQKVITENGYVDIVVELDKKGRLLSVQVERNQDYEPAA